MLSVGGTMRGYDADEYRYVLKIIRLIMIQIFQDALFAAIAAIGFAAISRPPSNAYGYCALIAAAGHSCRFMLIGASLHIIPATLVSSFIIGCLAVAVSRHAKFPAETCLFPSLLPMIPGIYAYKAFGGLALCLLAGSPQAFLSGFYHFAYNSMMCCSILSCMVIGATLPTFIFKKISFSATRQN